MKRIYIQPSTVMLGACIMESQLCAGTTTTEPSSGAQTAGEEYQQDDGSWSETLAKGGDIWDYDGTDSDSGYDDWRW